MRPALLALAASMVAALTGPFVVVESASAATLSYASTGSGSAAKGTLTYTGSDAAESLSVESISATGVKFFNLVAGQIATPVPSGCTVTNVASNGTMIVSCTIAGLSDVAVALAGGDDTLRASGLSKPSRVQGGAGADDITGGSDADTIYGDGGIDTINSGPAVDTIFVRDGLADTVDCGGALDNLNGDTVDVYNGCETKNLSDELVADADADGFKPPADCDDTRADVHPGATDVPGDGLDQDCDGRDAFVASPTPTPTPTPGTGTGAGTGTSGGTSGATPTKTPTPTPTPASAALPTPTPTPSAAKPSTASGTATTAATSGAPRVTSIPRVTFVVSKKRRVTRATKVVVDAVPAGATVRVRCKGKNVGCPVARYKKTFKTGALHLVVRSLFDRSALRVGARVEVRVTLPGAVGTSTRYRVNARSRPDSQVRCLAPTTSAPIAC